MAKMHKYQPVIQLGNIGGPPPVFASTLMSPEARVWLKESRIKWKSRMEFFLSCVGMAIGIGNVWRFPYMTYKYGGASFIFPYMILFVTVCVPLYFLEMAIGQFSSCSAIEVWKCCPIAKGIGWGMTLANLYTLVYYNVFVAYCVYYMFASFGIPLPWESCENEWNDDYCFEIHNKNYLSKVAEFCIGYKVNSTPCPYETAAEQYWLNRVIRVSKDMQDLGNLRWDLALCLCLCWLILWLVVVRGIRTSGKVVVVTAMCPYIFLIILFIRAVFLPGSSKGFGYLFLPEWKRLLDTEVWRGAAEQMFYSTSLCWGVVTMLSSYNEFAFACMHVAIVVVILDFVVSMMTTITIFSVMGNIANNLDFNIGDIIHIDTGLAFVIYPEVVTLLPAANFWGVLLFFMVFILGLDSAFAQLEAVIANVRDAQPFIGRHTFLVTFLLCLVCFLCGLPLVMEGGIFLVSVLDHYTATTNVLLLGFLELGVLMWVYGVKRIRYDLEFMLEIHLSYYWLISWAITCPAILATLCTFAWINFETASFRNQTIYSSSHMDADIIGGCISYSTLLPVPIIAVCTLVKHYKKKHIRHAWKPRRDWGPENPLIHRLWMNYSTEFSSIISSSSRSQANINSSSNHIEQPLSTHSDIYTE